ncbi:MAG TPA: DUF1003 domain-containing protein [Patescibacteria group bacterium]|nr:DUF1003 domain-containing protein [Patescibacteria group bacterium]
MASLKQTENRRKFFKSFEAKSLRSRSFLTQVADDLTAVCGSTPFLIFHVIFFSTWIVINVGLVAEIIKPFDPYPFGFLTLIVSLEAIFLSIFILVSQNRSSYVSTIRDEVHLGVNLIAEEEITKILEVLADIRREMGIKKPDPQLDKMLDRIDTGYIERSIMQQMGRANKSLAERMISELPTPITHPKTIIGGTDNVQSSSTSSKSFKTEKKSSDKKTDDFI